MNTTSQNMNKTIIAVYGRAQEGKSTTIKNVVSIFEAYPFASVTYLQKGEDILATIDLGGIKVGAESQGDPNSRMFYVNTVEELIKVHNCDIVLCATRTEGMTVKKVDSLADSYGYHTLWKSSYYTPSLNHSILNKIAAEEIVELIHSLIAGRF